MHTTGLLPSSLLGLCLFATGARAAVETITLNGKTYDVETKDGYPLRAVTADVEIGRLDAASGSSLGDQGNWHWLWQAQLKRSGKFKVTVTTPLDESVSTVFEVSGPGAASEEIFQRSAYPTLWTWVDDEQRSWLPFVFSFKNAESGAAFEVTQWLRFDPKDKQAFKYVSSLEPIRRNADKALVYVLRDDSTLLGHIDVFVDQTPIGLLPHGSYVTFETDAGWHLLWGECPGEWLELVANHAYLLRTALVGQPGFNRQCDEWHVGDPDDILPSLARSNLAKVVLSDEARVELEERLKRYARARKKAGEPPAARAAANVAAVIIDSDKPPGLLAGAFGAGKKVGMLSVSTTEISYRSSEHMLDVPLADVRAVSVPRDIGTLGVRYDEQGTVKTALFSLFGESSERNGLVIAIQNSQKQ